MRVGSIVTIRVAHGRERVQTYRAARPPEGFVDRDVVCEWCARPVRCRIFGVRETRRRRAGYVLAGALGILAGLGILAYLQGHARQRKPPRVLHEQLLVGGPGGGVLALLAIGFVCSSLVGLGFLLRAWREIGVAAVAGRGSGPRPGLRSGPRPGPRSTGHRVMRPLFDSAR